MLKKMNKWIYNPWYEWYDRTNQEKEKQKKKLASPNYEGEQDPPNYGFFSSREIMGPRVFFSRTSHDKGQKWRNPEELRER